MPSDRTSAAGEIRRSLVVAGLCALSGCAGTEHSGPQQADDRWQPAVARPAYPQDNGPLVLVDAAHGNFHTIEGRYAPFAELLRLDGYRVESAHGPATAELLGRGSVYVVANAVLGGDEATWTLPTPAAFTAEEIGVIVDWVADGGSLLLIADHMPFPGSAAALADAFGIVFYDGYAMRSIEEGGSLTFTRASGALAEHPITEGRSAAEAVESVRSFTGQAFRWVTAAEPLLHLPDDWRVYLPTAAGEFDAMTPVVSARGLVQGAVLRFGQGRVAVFGEAAMFTAQSWVRDGVVGRMGMNHPEASGNAQFVLNVLHWLSGLLDGEDEQGSPAVGRIIDEQRELLDADLMLFCNGPMHASRRPQLVFGVRGIHADCPSPICPIMRAVDWLRQH